MKLIENARESFQSAPHFIPAKLKIQYLNQLMEIGYYAVDVGEISNINTQFSDIEEVIDGIEKRNTKISVLAKTEEGLFQASKNPKIDLIEIPFSLLKKLNKSLISEKIAVNFFINFNDDDYIKKFKIAAPLEYCKQLGINKIKFYNQVSEINETNMTILFKNCIEIFFDIRFGAHFYVEENAYKSVFKTSVLSGCQFFEVSIKGWGRNEIGNTIPTEKILTYLIQDKNNMKINLLGLETAYNTSKKIFSGS